MYKILIVGHGGFPKGIKEALEFIVGKQKGTFYKTILPDKGHDGFELEINKFYKKHNNILVFADLSGGAPHQICVKKAVQHAKKNIFIVSGAPLAFLIEFIVKNPLSTGSKANNLKILNALLIVAQKMARVVKA